MQIGIISNSFNFTRNTGKIFSKILTGGNIIIFTGELGGGKTTFISGIAEGLGVTYSLSSPSFTLINEYRISGRRKFIHADLYRLDGIAEISDTGIDDYLYNGSSIVCVEWGDRIRDYIKKEFLEINLSYPADINNAETKRKIIFKSNTCYWDRKLEEFKRKSGKNIEFAGG